MCAGTPLVSTLWGLSMATSFARKVLLIRLCSENYISSGEFLFKSKSKSWPTKTRRSRAAKFMALRKAEQVAQSTLQHYKA